VIDLWVNVGWKGRKTMIMMSDCQMARRCGFAEEFAFSFEGYWKLKMRLVVLHAGVEATASS
jgi:hypothetical protein